MKWSSGIMRMVIRMERRMMAWFKLDELPDTEGKTVKLKLKWKSFSGDKSAEFDYCTRKSVAPSEPAAAAVRSNLKLK